MIVGLGIDIIRIKRLENGINQFGNRYINKIYTCAEIDYCQKYRNAIEHFAGKFSVKEAFMKAIGAGIKQGVWFRDIEVLNYETQKPYIKVYNKAAEYYHKLNSPAIHISITHTEDNAAAVVILEV